jgi:hypothetical protein
MLGRIGLLEVRAMTRKILLGVIALVALSIDANAFSSVEPGGGWSNLRTQRLQQLPSVVRAEILKAQKLCGGDSIDVRNGFIRYLKDGRGNDFIALHFDQFRCRNRSALCTSTGCLHKIFAAQDGLSHREVWRDHVQEVGMTNEAGRMSVDVDCGREGRYCASTLHWNGRQLVH